tara:strand:- start:1203 stop:1958 length:756 start_codon:yes stop_codon:yes gene_type:complete
MIKSNRGQVTIFVIIGIVVVVGILLFMFLREGTSITRQFEENPKQFIIDCAEDAVKNSLAVLMANGGEIIMSQSIEHYGESYNYLCYSGDFFRNCYNLHPMLQYLIESELREDTRGEVQDCFDSLGGDLQDKGYEFSADATDYSIDLLPGIVRINLDKKINIVRGNYLQSFENFDSEILSPAYGLVQVTNDIINDETVNCKFDNYYYMRLNPEQHIKKINFEDNRFYRLTDRKTGVIFKFAVRNCVLPHGL